MRSASRGVMMASMASLAVAGLSAATRVVDRVNKAIATGSKSGGWRMFKSEGGPIARYWKSDRFANCTMNDGERAQVRRQRQIKAGQLSPVYSPDMSLVTIRRGSLRRRTASRFSMRTLEFLGHPHFN